MANDLIVRVDATTANFDRAMSTSAKAALRFEAATAKAAEAAATLDKALAESGVGSDRAIAAQSALTASTKRLDAAMEQSALADKRATEIQVADAAKRSAAAEAAAVKQAAALKKVGTVYGAVGAAAALVLVAGAKAAADFDAKVALVGTLSHASAGDVAKLAAATKDYANIGYSASQAADAEAELVKAGISVQGILGGGLKASLTAAAAGQMDVASATNIMVQAMTQFQLKGKDLPHVADLLSAGADKALGSMQDLGDALSYAGLAAHQLGVPIQDAVGTLAEFANAGLIGQKGGTAFQQMLLKLEDPSAKAAAELKTLGINIYNAQGRFVGMTSLAGQLHDKLQGVDEATRNAALATIFGQRAIRGAMVLYQGGAQATQQWINKINDTGFAMHQATGKLNSAQGDWAKFKATLDNTAIDMGQSLQPAIRSTLQTLTGFLHVFDDIPGPIKSIAVEFGILVAGLGLGMYAFTRVTAAIRNMRAELALLRGQEITTAETGALTNDGLGKTTTTGGLLGGPLSKGRLGIQAGGLLGATALQYAAGKAGGGTTPLGSTLNVGSGALAGAAIGSIFPGPGTAIGAGLGAVVGGIQSVAQSSAAAAAAQKSLDDAATAVAGSLNKETGAATGTTRSLLQHTFQQQGAINQANQLGISTHTLTQYVMGNKGAFDQVNSAIAATSLTGQQWRDQSLSGQVDAAKGLGTTLDALRTKYLAQQDAIKRAGESQVVAGQSVQRMGSAVDEEGHNFQASVGPILTAKQAMDKYGDATVAALNATLQLDNKALGRHGDWLNLNQSILSVEQALKKVKDRTLDVHSSNLKTRQDALNNTQLLQSEAGSILQVAAGFKKGSDQQIAFLTSHRNSMLQQVEDFGLSRKAAEKYVDSILNIPTDWKTKADFDSRDAEAALKRMIGLEETARQKAAEINQAFRGIGSGGHVVVDMPGLPHHAAGTMDAPGGWSIVGERGPELRYVEPHTKIYPTQRTAAMLAGGAVMGSRSGTTLAGAVARLSHEVRLLASRGQGTTYTGEIHLDHAPNLDRALTRATNAAWGVG